MPAAAAAHLEQISLALMFAVAVTPVVRRTMYLWIKR
jgi:hypothetical protein